MKNIVESIKKDNYSEWHNVECTNDLKVDRKSWSVTFKSGDNYNASKINNNWWLIDQIGVSTEDFQKHFKDI